MRIALAMVVLVVAASDARAETKRKVLVDSDPPGADVYLNSKDDGSLCKTPCTIEAPVGETPIIVELANHLPKLENLLVPKRGKTTAKFTLLPAVGTIIVTGPKGAGIRVADEDKGVAPARFDIDAGPYMVVLTLNGKQIDSQAVEVAPGEEVTVAGPTKVAAVAPSVEEPVAEPVAEPGGEITKRATPRAPRGRLFSLSAAFDVGFRSFQFEGVLTQDKLRKEDEVGQVIGGGALEVWLGNLMRVRALRGLSLFGRWQVPLNRQPVTSKDMSIKGTTTTFWQTIEATLRQRWTIANTGAIEIGAGYARDEYTFNTNMTADLDLVPGVIYNAVKLGARGSLLLGAVEPYLSLGYRLVLSGGDLDRKFEAGASASGVHAALGFKAKAGPIDATLEGSITRYSWTFKDDPTAAFRASGATDSIMLVSASIGYVY